MSNNRKPALLYLNPRDAIVFEGPFNRLVRETVVIENPRKIQSVSFKIKFTMPQMFFVHPNTGLLQPGQKVTVEIFLKPILGDFGQSPMFVIQAAVVFRPTNFVHGVWRVQEATLWTAKIKCEFVQDKSLEVLFGQAGFSAIGFEERNEEQISISDNRDMAANGEMTFYGSQNFFKFFMFLPIMAAAILGVYYGNQH